MSRRKMISLLILIAYSVPYVFLGMYGDRIYHSLWLYGLMAAAMSGLGWYCGKQNGFPLRCLGISCLC